MDNMNNNTIQAVMNQLKKEDNRSVEFILNNSMVEYYQKLRIRAEQLIKQAAKEMKIESAKEGKRFDYAHIGIQNGEVTTVRRMGNEKITPPNWIQLHTVKY